MASFEPAALVQQGWSLDEVDYIRSTARELRNEKRKIILKKKKQNPSYTEFDDSFIHEDYDLIATGLGIIRATDTSRPERTAPMVQNLLIGSPGLLDTSEKIDAEYFGRLMESWKRLTMDNDSEGPKVQPSSEQKGANAKNTTENTAVEADTNGSSKVNAKVEGDVESVSKTDAESFTKLLNMNWDIGEVNELVKMVDDQTRKGLGSEKMTGKEKAKALSKSEIDEISSKLTTDRSSEDILELLTVYPSLFDSTEPLLESEYSEMVKKWTKLTDTSATPVNGSGTDISSRTRSSRKRKTVSLSAVSELKKAEQAKRPRVPSRNRKRKKVKASSPHANPLIHNIECTNLNDVETLMEFARQQHEDSLVSVRLKRIATKQLKKRLRKENSPDSISLEDAEGLEYRDPYEHTRTGRRKTRILTGPLDDLGLDEVAALKKTDKGRLVLRLVAALHGQFRQRCLYEFFYSNIDEPFFAHNEFEECLESLHSKGISIGKWQKFARCEWGLIRQQMGKPRRLSPKFFADERHRLNEFRDSVRAVQTQAGSDAGDAFPYEVIAPLQVGARVTAVHRGSKSLASGQILTVDKKNFRYQVQFDVPRLGVMTCPDYDVRPSGPVSIVNPKSGVASRAVYKGRIGILDSFTGLRSSHCLKRSSAEDADSLSFHDDNAFEETVKKMKQGVKPESNESVWKAQNFEASADTAVDVAGSTNPPDVSREDVTQIEPMSSVKENEQAETNDEEPEKLVNVEVGDGEENLMVFSRLLKLLDRKEVIIAELRYMNGIAEKYAAPRAKGKETFQEGYEWVRKLLDKTNEEVTDVMKDFRSLFLNGKAGASFAESHKTDEKKNELTTNELPNQKEEAHDVETTDTGPRKGLSEWQKQFKRRWQKSARLLTHQLYLATLEPGSKDKGDVKDRIDLSDDALKLVTSCISILLAIRHCAEKGMSPLDVHLSLSAALDGIRPKSEENMAIFNEIEASLSLIKAGCTPR